MEDLREKTVADDNDEMDEEELEELKGGVTVVSGKRPSKSDKISNTKKKEVHIY